MRLRRFRPLLLLLCVPGCQGWHRRDLPRPGTGPAAASDVGRVRVTHADGRVLELRRAQLAGDSLVGEAGAPPGRVAVALSDVRRLEERRASRLVGVALFVGAIAGVAALVVSGGSAPRPNIPPPSL